MDQPHLYQSTSSRASDFLVLNVVFVSGIAGSLVSSALRLIANFQISSTHLNGRKIDLTAIVLPKVTCDLPVTPVPFDLSWTYLSGLPLADPGFGEPQCIDLLFGVDIFVDVLHHGCQTGPTGAPVAIETEFGWVVCGGSTVSSQSSCCITSCLSSGQQRHSPQILGDRRITCKLTRSHT